MNLEMICYFLECQYFEQFKTRHPEITDETTIFFSAYPNEWQDVSFEERISILERVVNENTDIITKGRK